MPKSKLYFRIFVLCILTLLLGSCAVEPSLEIKSAVQAKDVVLEYLQEYDVQNAPSSNIAWQEEDITPQNWVGGVFKEFTSEEWTIQVNYAVLPLENTVYEVTVSSTKLGWHWKGEVKAVGTVTEISAFQQMTEEASKEVAEDFVMNSPTFVFDGIEDSFKLTETIVLRCPYCWQCIFEFDSAHAGYGDRTGQMLAEVITHHVAIITIDHMEVSRALMDDQWDMLRQEMISVEESLEVSELIANPVYDTPVRIQGIVGRLGEFFCPCFELSSGGETVMVWYDLMVENDGTQRPPANKHEFDNDDRVIVVGELKGDGGTHYCKGDFWAMDIIKIISAPPAEDVEIRQTPIHEIQVNIAESYPPQVVIYIKGGLLDGCTTFHELNEERMDSTINIEVTTQHPKNKICPPVYGYFEKNVNLGTDFVSGEIYKIYVNDEMTIFTMQ